MKKFLEKRGQKIAKRFTKISKKVGEESVDHVKENLVDRISHVKHVRLLVLEWSLLVAGMIILSLIQTYWYSDSYATTTYTTGGTYTEATLGKVNSLNPLFASTSSEKALSKLMFATLASTDYSGHVGLNLAESITMDDTGKAWTVKLRDGLKWSDGEALTNEDVLFSVELIKDPKTNTAYQASLTGIEVSQDDKNNLIFKLARPNVYFSTAMDFPILPKHALKDVPAELLLEDSFSVAPVTSGPFVYNAAQTVGNEGEKIVYLSPNEQYFKGKPMLDSFAVHAFLSTDEIITALNNGTVSATAELSSGDQDKITNPAVGMRQTSLNYGVYAFINLDSKILNSQPLRKTIRQGLSVDKLRSFLRGEQGLDYPLVENQLSLPEYPKLPEEDFLKAKDSISTILGANNNAELRIVTVDAGYLPEIAGNLAEQLTDLGLEASLEVYEPNQDFILNVLRPRSYDILVYEIGLGPDPDVTVYYHSSHANSTGYNLSNYRNAIVNDFLASARSTLDYTARTKKYEKFLRRWVDDVPAIGIYQTSLTYYVNKNVRTFSSENKLVYATDRFNDVIYWAAEKTTRNRTP